MILNRSVHLHFHVSRARATEHLRADDVDNDDEMERWGKRIARILALIAFIWLAYHVVVTYVLPG